MEALEHALAIGRWALRAGPGADSPRAEGHYLHIDAPVEGGLPALLAEVHAEDRAGLLAAAEQAAHAGTGLVHAFRSARSPTRFLRIAALVRNDAGVLVLPQGCLVDETPRVVSEARLDVIAGTTPAILWLMEPNGFCSFFSRSWYEYTGQTPEEALGLGWLQKVHPEDIGMAAECANRAVQLKSYFRIEHRLRHRDGSWRWVLCVGNPRFDEEGLFVGHSGAVTDIHERRVSERLLRGRRPVTMHDSEATPVS